MHQIAILSDDQVPRDDEFRFRDRAGALVDKWYQDLVQKPSVAESGGANGKAKSNGGDMEEAVMQWMVALGLNV
jgi:hypothetical protein